MAFTTETISKSVFGNKRVTVTSCSIDSASGNVDTGLALIEWFSVQPISMATTSGSFKKNVGSGATARNGIFNLNSCASGDVFYLVAYGR